MIFILFRRIYNNYKALSLLISSLALLMLIIDTFDFGISKPILLVLQYYNSLLNFLLGWLTPYITSILTYINNFIWWKLELGEHWKHIFVLLWIYFVTNASTNWGLNRKWYATLTLIWGLQAALISSVIAATLPLQGVFSIIAALSPILGIIYFEFGRSAFCAIFMISTPAFDAKDKLRVDIFNYYFKTYGAPVFLSSVPILIILHVTNLKVLNEIKIVEISVLLCTVSLATIWIGRAAWLGLFDRVANETFLLRYKRSGSSIFGHSILLSIAGMLCLLILNAAFKSVGL